MAVKNVKITYPADVLDVLSSTCEKASEVLKEAATLELYRQGRISSGKAAEILRMERFEFIRYAGKKGIPYLRPTHDELEAEVKMLGDGK